MITLSTPTGGDYTVPNTIKTASVTRIPLSGLVETLIPSDAPEHTCSGVSRPRNQPARRNDSAVPAMAAAANDAPTLASLAETLEHVERSLTESSTDDASLSVDDNLAMILESMPEGAIARDRSGRIVLVNRAALELLGCDSRRDLDGLSVADLITEFDMRDQDGRLLTAEAIPTSALLAGGVAVPRVMSLRRRSDQSRRWVIVNGCAIRDYAGNVRLTVKLTQDVTEHYRSSEIHRVLNAIRDTIQAEPLDIRRAASQVELLVADVIGGSCTVSLCEDIDGLRLSGGSDALAPEWALPALGKDLDARVASAPERELTRIERLSYFPVDVASWSDFVAGGREAGQGSDPRVVVLPLRDQDRVLGTMRCSRSRSMPAFDVGDVQMLHDIAERVSSTIANARLRFELAQRRRMLEMAVRQIEEVEEIERRRVALSIHDGLAQVATSVYQHLEAFASRYPAAESEAHDDLVRAQELARRTIREARRLIASMRPTVLDDFGLVPALLEEMGEMQAGGWEVRFSNDLGDERFPHRTELELFRVAQEALSNIRKHAGKTRVHIVLQHRDDALHLSVRDEGAGFDMEAVRRAGNSSEHVGLGGMRERIELLGGTIHIRSRPDEGTLLVVRVPLTAT